jgi:hypothetical protein
VGGTPSGVGASGAKVGSAVSPKCGPGGRAASTARWTGLDQVADSTAEPDPAGLEPATGGVPGGIGAGITVDAIGQESDSNGATSIGSPSLPLPLPSSASLSLST